MWRNAKDGERPQCANEKAGRDENALGRVHDVYAALGADADVLGQRGDVMRVFGYPDGLCDYDAGMRVRLRVCVRVV